jgi:prefoldin subunit 5
MAPQEELKYLKDQANAIRRELSEIDSRIHELEPGT